MKDLKLLCVLFAILFVCIWIVHHEPEVNAAVQNIQSINTEIDEKVSTLLP